MEKIYDVSALIRNFKALCTDTKGIKVCPKSDFCPVVTAIIKTLEEPLLSK